jgi:hypothetical protein
MADDARSNAAATDEVQPTCAPSGKHSTTIHESNAWSPRWIVVIVVLILVVYFSLQKLLLTEAEPDQDLRWLDEWNVATASGESVGTRNELLRTAFEARPLSNDANPNQANPVTPALDVALRRLTQGARQADGDVLLESIDWPTYLAAVRRSKYFREGKDDQSLEVWAQAGALYPWYWESFQVIYSESVGRKRHRALTLLVDSTGHHFHEVRWWFIVRDERWLVYDWEVIDFGVRETTEAALEWSLRGHPALRAYDDLLFADRSDPSIFERALPIPAPLSDSLYVQLAYDYLETEQWEVAARMADRVRRPDIAIGASVAKAQAHLFLGQSQKAKRATDRLFKDVGLSIHVRDLRDAIADM